MDRLIDIWTNTNYQVTEDGKVWSKRTKKWLKPLVDKDGYFRVNLGYGNLVGIHRLVFEAFYRRLLPNEIVHHLSGVKNQNTITNLVAWDRARHSQEHNIGNHYKTGKKASAQTKRKLSQAKIGNKNHLGFKHSEQTRQKMKQAWKRRKERMKNENKEIQTI